MKTSEKLKIITEYSLYVLSIIIILILSYQTFFVETQDLGMDNWGLTGPYVIKLILAYLSITSIFLLYNFAKVADKLYQLELEVERGYRCYPTNKRK